MSSIGSISASVGTVLQTNTRPRTSAALYSVNTQAASATDNEAAVREWKKYRRNNSDFSGGFKNVLTALRSAAAKLTGSSIASTTDEKTAKVSYDYKSSVKSVADFVDAYNDTVEYLRGKRQLSGVSSVLNDYKRTRTLSAQLEKVGISLDASGKMKLDEKAMKTALQKDRSLWEDVLTKSQSSLAVRINRLTNKYINKTDGIINRPSVSIEA